MYAMKAARGKGFSEEEKMFLLELVDGQKGILLNKRTDKVSNRQKAGAWEKITAEYNKHFPTKQRISTNLKKLYENMKRKTRQGVAETNRNSYLQNLQKVANEDKREMNRTGGGSYKPQLTNEQERVLAMLGDTVKPLANPYDSAANYFNDKPSIAKVNPINSETEPPEPSTSQDIHTNPPLPAIQATPEPSTSHDIDTNPPLPAIQATPEPSTSQDIHTNPPLPATQATHNQIKDSEYWRTRYYKQKTLNAELQQKILELELLLKQKQLEEHSSRNKE